MVTDSVTEPTRVAAAGRALALVGDAQPGLQRLVELTRAVLSCAGAVVSLVDGRHEHLAVVSGFPEPFTSGASVPLELGLCVPLVVDATPRLLPDLHRDARLCDHPAVAVLGMRSYAGVPLVVGAHVVGGLCVLDAASRDWTPEEEHRLAGLAAAVATELGLRAALHDEARAREEGSRLAAAEAAMARCATAVAQGLSADEVLAVVADEVARLVGAQAAVVVRFHPDGRAEPVAAGGPGALAPDLCARTVASLRHDGAAVADVDGDVPCTAAPVVVAGRLWGALVAAGGVTGDALPHLQRLADLLALGIRNAQAQERLLDLARSDPLTGAANRRGFSERLAAELDRARRHRLPTTLVVLDVDRFKDINDAHGHVTGDRVLVELVGRVDAHLRHEDVLGRLGGDEFVLLLPDTGYDAALQVLERVRRAVAEVPVAGVAVTVSAGAVVVEDGAAAARDLYRRADEALYRAKGSGRDTVVVDRLS